jgi:hypothetical protein
VFVLQGVRGSINGGVSAGRPVARPGAATIILHRPLSIFLLTFWELIAQCVCNLPIIFVVAGITVAFQDGVCY